MFNACLSKRDWWDSLSPPLVLCNSKQRWDHSSIPGCWSGNTKDNEKEELSSCSILTVDVIFLDEAGQISSKLLSVISIIFYKLWNSQMPFGGVLVIDHTQLQPINTISFLMSSLILRSFTMVQLKETVCAAKLCSQIFRSACKKTKQRRIYLCVHKFNLFIESPAERTRNFSISSLGFVWVYNEWCRWSL